ncbi:hypothetical protein ACIQM4_15285 [Streptomyces sp. NPDC091272]|uniref:hypothetical protein n=1 Tax=Streptomyces sp. NPDC091272 TaxID=3365981 RepID=UPI00380ED30B
MNLSANLAVEGGPPLVLITVGVVLVVLLVGAFAYGSRRSARKQQISRIDTDHVEFGDGGHQRGKTWQTIDDDPDQGAPHR